MLKEHQSWLVLAAVTVVVVFLGMRTLGTTTQAQEKSARPLQIIWSQVKDAGGPVSSNVYRAKVPGGWLVLVHQQMEKGQRNGSGYGHGVGVGAGVTFVPDPEHAW